MYRKLSTSFYDCMINQYFLNIEVSCKGVTKRLKKEFIEQLDSSFFDMNIKKSIIKTINIRSENYKMYCSLTVPRLYAYRVYKYRVRQ